MVRMLYVLNTLKSNQLKAPFQGAKIAGSLVWMALAVFLGCHRWVRNRGLEIENKDKNLLVTFYPWCTWGHSTFTDLNRSCFVTLNKACSIMIIIRPPVQEASGKMLAH
jgi:hypothetical protein